MKIPKIPDARPGSRQNLRRLVMKPGSGPAGKRPGAKILIADDDGLTRRLLQKTLKEAGYEVVTAEDGHAALECLSGKDRPRLALLDWIMPGLNGLEVC